VGICITGYLYQRDISPLPVNHVQCDRNVQLLGSMASPSPNTCKWLPTASKRQWHRDGDSDLPLSPPFEGLLQLLDFFSRSSLKVLWCQCFLCQWRTAPEEAIRPVPPQNCQKLTMNESDSRTSKTRILVLHTSALRHYHHYVQSTILGTRKSSSVKDN